MAEGGYIESEPFEALQLKEEGNHFLKAGEFEPALDCYQRALTSLSQGGRGSAREVATVLGNVSCAQLSLGQPQLALEAARDAWRKDPSYSKALFREAKALLALGQFTDAVRAALHLLFLCGSSVEADVLKILEAAQEKPSQRPLQLGPATSAPSSSEATVESLQLVARCCDGEDLARLAQGNRRFWRQLSDQEVLDRAALVCPGASAGWLRRDATLGSAGWTFALHQAHGRSCVHDCVAVSTPGGALALVHLAADFTVLKEEALCTSGRCLDFTLCWGPHGEYVAFTAVTESQNTALVITPTKSMRRPPLVIPLIPFLTPYYLCPSPCGTRLAFLGSVKNQQVLMVADLSPLLISLPQAVARVKCLGSAAPLYFDWAPHAPELLAVCHEKKLVRLVAELPVGQRPSLREPTEESIVQLDTVEGTDIHGRFSFRAPQWLPHPSPEGRWLVPRDRQGRVSLALVDPTTDEAEIVCEHLPPEAHFTAGREWVAWCGLHDERGHGGVFARRILPTLGPPLMVFTHPNRVEGMAWGGDRLGLLIHAPNCLVWTVWDARAAEGTGSRGGSLTVAPQGFVPNRVFSGRVLPFFDQFERRLRFWNPGNDAIVYADSDSEVWVQPFPRLGTSELQSASAPQPPAPHPLSSLAGTNELAVAPPRIRSANHVICVQRRPT